MRSGHFFFTSFRRMVVLADDAVERSGIPIASPTSTDVNVVALQEPDPLGIPR